MDRLQGVGKKDFLVVGWNDERNHRKWTGAKVIRFESGSSPGAFYFIRLELCGDSQLWLPKRVVGIIIALRVPGHRYAQGGWRSSSRINLAMASILTVVAPNFWHDLSRKIAFDCNILSGIWDERLEGN